MRIRLSYILCIAFLCFGCVLVSADKQAKQEPLPSITDVRAIDTRCCAWCGCTDKIEEHHIIPKDCFVSLGIKELMTDDRNLVWLCDCPKHHCHLLIGHCGSFSRYNLYLGDMLALKYKMVDEMKRMRSK